MLRRKTTAIPVVLGTALFLGLASAGAAETIDALPAGNLESADEAAGDTTDAEDEKDGADGPQIPSKDVAGDGGESPSVDFPAGSAAPLAVQSAIIMRDGSPVEFDTLEAAVEDARDGEEVLVQGSFQISSPITVSGGKTITLRATSAASITRTEDFPQAGGKPQGLVRVIGRSSLIIKADDPAAPLVLDGEQKDSDEAIITVRESSSLTMGEGAIVRNAKASWKPWAGVYVHSGSLMLDGGEIRDGFAQKNAAVAVERSGSFEMRSGKIENNKSTYSEASVWISGKMTVTGGSITGNTANSGASTDGVVYILNGGSLSFTGGTIGDSSVTSSYAIKVGGGSLTMGGSARIAGSDRIALAGTTSITFESPLSEHTIDSPLPVTLLASWDPGRTVATFKTAEDACGALSYLSVKTGGQTPEPVTLAPDDTDPTRLAVASGDLAELVGLLDNPYEDDLGLVLKPAFIGEGAFERFRDRLTDAYGGVDTPESRERFKQLDRLERQASYLAANQDAVQGSIITLSQLGDPSADRARTKQNFMFDNLDATGYYLKPGQVNEFYLYVEAEDPSKLALAWRQVGLTENNQFSVLNLFQRTDLKRGVNRVVVDLTDKTYGYMLYLRNDSTDNAARARLEAIDACEPGADPVVGTQLGAHPYYLHDTGNPAAFWNFVQEIRSYAEAVERGEAQDMALLQMGDEGRAQFAIRASALASAYAGIGSEQDAIAYIERSNAAIQERLEFFWAFDGFDADAAEGPNAVSRMRVHTAFTKTVSYPSTMYATGRYFHMPESSAAAFLAGTSMYGWGMSHEYGHVLDNSVTVVNEETNNMYSIAGARNGELIASRAAGRAFKASGTYHQNAIRAARLWDAELERMAADPYYTPDWNEGGWGYYIWAHLSAWWNGSHFFDGWDYSGYDYASSPFTAEDAQTVADYGAFGATMRILRGDADAVSQIEGLTASIQDGTSRKYNRIAIAYTMGTGYDFAKYLEIMGEGDLTDEVKEFCARYPEMPRKVQYYNLFTDEAELNGATAYEGNVAPIVTVSAADGATRVEAEMATDALAASTCAYELYIDGELAGFSRTGSFQLDEEVDSSRVSVISYDVRLNPSREASASDAPFGVSIPKVTVGDGAAKLDVEGPRGATYTFSVEDESIVEVDEDGNLTAKSAGSTWIMVTMHRAGKPDAGPYRFGITVEPRKVTVRVSDASMYTGASLPRPDLEVSEGSLLEGDELGEATFSARTEDGSEADLGEPGSYLIEADLADMGPNYDVKVVPGTLTVSQEEADGDWVKQFDADGDPIDDGAWSSGAVSIRAAGAHTGAGTYDLIALDGAQDGFLDSVIVEMEGETVRDVRLSVGSGPSAGAFSSSVPVTTRIDSTAPTIEIEVNQEARTAEGTTVVARAADAPAEGANASSGVERVELVATNAVTGEKVLDAGGDGSSRELVLDEEGTYRVTARSFDAAGNASEEAQTLVEVAPADEGGGELPGGGGDGGSENPGGGGDGGSENPGGGGDGGSENPGDGDITDDGEGVGTADKPGDDPADEPGDGDGGAADPGEPSRDEERAEGLPSDGADNASGNAGGNLARTSDPSLAAVAATALGFAASVAAGIWLKLRRR